MYTVDRPNWAKQDTETNSATKNPSFFICLSASTHEGTFERTYRQHYAGNGKRQSTLHIRRNANELRKSLPMPWMGASSASLDVSRVRFAHTKSLSYLGM